ncbi:septum formation initiator family protein [Omnitrophica bacterium]|nr:septum formation initiator family protein [Candidatus Omnitrophota bacterium]
MTRRNLIILTAIVAVVIIAVILLPGYTKLQDLMAENKRLEERITGLGKSIEDLKKEKEKLESDILYIEKVAREKLGVVREDEVVIKERP